MATWRLSGGAQQVADSASWTSSQYVRTAVVASSTAHAKGAWTQVVAATSTTWRGFLLLFGTRSTGATDTSSLLDVGIGDAGSEVVIVADLPVGYTAGGTALIPIEVPAGVRVALRRQDAVGSNNTAYGLYPIAGEPAGGGAPRCAAATTYGTTAATSQGTAVTAASNNTFGSWVELAAATSSPIRRLLVGIQGNGDTDVAANSAFSIEIGVGAAGAEVAVARLGSFTGSAEFMNAYPFMAGLQSLPGVVPLALSIPEGSRLAVRYMAAAAGTTNPSIDVTLIGMR
jgi:hypothetical protein